ncbi:MAG: DMT family transporter, partial [Propionibacteriaceae bacterium]|nr:DMT family transporter [Propionibacteriaceae bacterium]
MKVVEAPVGSAHRGDTRISGIAFALVSALSFSLSGTIGAGLFATGWSPGAVVFVRTAMGAVVAAPFGLRAMRGRWRLVRRHLRPLLAFGIAGVSLTQFAYLSAVQTLDVGVALLIEYSSPVIVVVWLWLFRHQRPSRLTGLGAVLAPIGLLLVLDIFSGATLDAGGVAWALCATGGAVSYYLVASDTTNALPPIAFASGGLIVGT